MSAVIAFLGSFFTDPVALTALAALVLSQLPPIRQLLKGKRLRLALPSRAQLYHSFGITQVNLWIDLENVGSKAINIGAIRALLIKRDGTLLQRLDAGGYWLTESFSREKPVELPLGEIALRPGER